MACIGFDGDYGCEGWVSRREAIRTRDSNRCRGRNRSGEDVRLEVHHRTYGKPGPCGNCYLTGVTDEDLVTLCSLCHDAITSVRRSDRYMLVEIEPAVEARRDVSITVVIKQPGSEVVTPMETTRDVPLAVRRKITWRGEVRHGMARSGQVGRGRDAVHQRDTASVVLYLGVERHHEAGPGSAWRGQAWRGAARYGRAGSGEAGNAVLQRVSEWATAP